MNTQDRARSGLLWFLAALMFYAVLAPNLGYIDGWLFPVVDREKTVFTEMTESGETVRFAGTGFKLRRCAYKGNDLTVGGVKLNYTRTGEINLVEIGPYEFGPFVAYSDKKSIICRLKMVTEHACYPLVPGFRTHTVMYDGAKSDNPLCK